MTDFDKMNRKIKHLEFIQSNISRMNQCSFKMKGWMITIDSAFLALFAASIDKNTGSGNTIYLFVATHKHKYIVDKKCKNIFYNRKLCQSRPGT